MDYSKKGGNSNYILTLGKGVLFSYIVTLAFFILFAIIMTYTNISEGIIPVVDSVVMIVSIVIGAIYMAVKTRKNGWVSGGFVGIVYILILLILRGLLFKGLNFDIYLIVKIAIALITGAVGGMIGINLK